jgi:CRISPR-associated protein Csx10
MSEALLPLRLELLDRVIFSADAATAGGHRSLAHVPGSALLGAFAGLAYPAWGGGSALAFHAFHAGFLRFRDAWPLSSEGAPAWPAPLSLHRMKKAAGRGGSVNWYNLAVPRGDRGRGEQQMREGFLTEDARMVTPRMMRSQRTAIDPARGRAATGQLFEYQALERGQVFVTAVEAVGAEGATALAALRELLGEAKVIRMGRSRGSEFGRVRVAVAAGAALPAAMAVEKIEAGAPVLFWALSDLALLDGCGQPTLRPAPQAFGLPAGACFAPEFSFVLPRQVWPHNAALGGRVMQRLTLAAGSVIAFHLPPGVERPPPGSLWLGALQEQGLGLVMRDPAMLHAAQVTAGAAPPPRPGTASPPPADEAEAAYLAWLMGRAADAAAPDDGVRIGLLDLRDLYAAAAQEGLLVPGPTQWGEVQAQAEACRDLAALKATLFDKKNGLCRADDPVWGAAAALAFRGGFTSLGEWLQGWLTDRRTPSALAALAREQQRALRRARGRQP